MDASRLRGQTCAIVTHGRRTGAEHAVRAWFVVVQGRFYAAARHGLASDWLQNALHSGVLEVRTGKVVWSGRASLAPDEDVPAVLDAYAEKYHRYPSIIAAWRANLPVFIRAAADRPGSVDAPR